MEYIIDRYSEDKLKEILRTPQKTPFEILGVEKDKFIEGWKKYVQLKY